MEAAIWGLIGIAVGGGITWLVSRHYYVQASADLTREAAKMSLLVKQVVVLMHRSGMASFGRDAASQSVLREAETWAREIESGPK